MLIAFVLFFAFGFLTSELCGRLHAAPDGHVLADLFHAAYMSAGLWFGHAFVAIGLAISALALAGYFWAGDWFDLWMASSTAAG